MNDGMKNQGGQGQGQQGDQRQQGDQNRQGQQHQGGQQGGRQDQRNPGQERE